MKYIAPETISGKKYDHMIDWWSLGIILYRMLTGSLPHPTNINRKIPYYIVNHKIKMDDPIFSKYAKDLLEKLLERNPAKRLGANGVDEIKNHKFFKDVNWTKVYNKKLKPPYVPGTKAAFKGNLNADEVIMLPNYFFK